jgi:hypothetical protein
VIVGALGAGRVYPLHDRRQVRVDVAKVLAGGREAIDDIDALPDQA